MVARARLVAMLGQTQFHGSPTGVEAFDFTQPPEKDGCKTHKVLWKLKKGEK